MTKKRQLKWRKRSEKTTTVYFWNWTEFQYSPKHGSLDKTNLMGWMWKGLFSFNPLIAVEPTGFFFQIKYTVETLIFVWYVHG